MRAAPSGIAAVVVVVIGFGCAATQVQPHHLDDPTALVGKTIQFQTPEGRHERIVVTRVVGTTVTGHRPWDSASAVRLPEELTFDLQTIVRLEGARIATEGGPRTAEAGAELVRDSGWMYGALPGDTVNIRTTQGRTEVVVVTAVGPTSITGYLSREPASVGERSAVTFQSADIERIEIVRSGVRGSHVVRPIAALQSVDHVLQHAQGFFGLFFITVVILAALL